jgi:translation initiation factor 1 (eIF-1/SUI1)
MIVMRNYLVWLRNYLEDLDLEVKILLKCIRKDFFLVGGCLVREKNVLLQGERGVAVKMEINFRIL